MKTSKILAILLLLSPSASLSQTAMLQEAAGGILGAYVGAYALQYACVSSSQNRETVERHRSAWRAYETQWQPLAHQTLQMMGRWRGERSTDDWYNRKVVEAILEEQQMIRTETNYCERMLVVIYPYVNLRNCCINQLRMLFPNRQW
jgi:hypothetical protein